MLLNSMWKLNVFYNIFKPSNLFKQIRTNIKNVQQFINIKTTAKNMSILYCSILCFKVSLISGFRLMAGDLNLQKTLVSWTVLNYEM